MLGFFDGFASRFVDMRILFSTILWAFVVGYLNVSVDYDRMTENVDREFITELFLSF